MTHEISEIVCGFGRPPPDLVRMTLLVLTQGNPAGTAHHVF